MVLQTDHQTVLWDFIGASYLLFLLLVFVLIFLLLFHIVIIVLIHRYVGPLPPYIFSG